MGKMVLVVDDQLGIRLLLSEVLRSEGFSVQHAGSGEEALAKAKEIQPDLILLDMKMPGMNGVELLKRLNKRFKWRVPVFLMTAYSELDMLEEAMMLGVNKQFTKPFDIFELCDAVLSEISNEISNEVCKIPTFCG